MLKARGFEGYCIMEFSKRLDLFGDEIFAALNERKVALEAQGRTIYNLSVGTPDFAPAKHIRKAMMDAAADPQNWKYSRVRLLQAPLRRRDHAGSGGQLCGQSGGRGPHWYGAVRRGRHRAAAHSLLPGVHRGQSAGRRKAVVLPADQGARLPALCEGHPGGCGPQGKVYDRLPARKPSGQRRLPGAVRRTGGLCQKV